MVKQRLAILAVVAAVFAPTVSASSNVSASLASASAVRASSGSCPGTTVPAVVNSTFVCLAVGGPCSARFGQDYTKFDLLCAAGRLVKASAATAPALADAFLNTKSSDSSTRTTAFKVAGPPPILHLTFKKALKGVHKLSVDVHSGKIGTDKTVDSTLQSGWQFTWMVLPAIAANSIAGTYRITISIDGAGSKQLFYTVKP